MENTYCFKVAEWQTPTAYYWYPPIKAGTYEQALAKLYSNEKLVAADLKAIITWGGIYKSGKDIYIPGNWDVNVN